MPPESETQLPLLGGLDGLLNGHIAPEALEEALAAEGIGGVVAIDEAGRGPLAGPVTAGAVVFDGPCLLEGVDDSKRLAPDTRRALVPRIRAAARACAVAEASAEEIDALNILEATRLAATRAVEALGVTPAVILTDALTLPSFDCPVVPIVRGDARVQAIGAASILAKEQRDGLLRRLARQWPQFGFEEHFGYPTPLHRARLLEHGPSTIHRHTFRGAAPCPGKPLIHSRFFHEMEALLAVAPPDERSRLRRRVTRRRGLLPEREITEMLRRCDSA